MKRKSALTIYDVSQLAGVSIATVSRAMNTGTRHKVAPGTLRRVTRVIEHCGYTPHLGARQLRGSTLKTIGVVLTHFPGLFFHDYHVQILAGVADALFETEYGLKLIMVKPSQQQRWDRYNFKTGEGVGGLIMTHWPKFFSKASVLERLQLPCVVINDPEPDLKVCFMSGDSLMGGELAARHLYAKGHRRVAVVAGPAWSCDSRLRVTGFTRFFKAAPAASHVTLLHGNYAKEQAYAEVTALFKQSRSVTAVFCCNDDMALSALRALRDLGLSCLTDVSVMGYDDDPRAQQCDPPLTTVRVPLYEIAKAGTQRLVQHLAGQETGQAFYGDVRFPVTLVERESVRERG